MWKKLGWLGEKLCFGFGALFTLIVIVQAALTACKGGAWGLAHLPAGFHPLLRTALADYRGETAAYNSARLPQFARYMLAQLSEPD